MKFTFLGTGSVKASPLYGCNCIACQRALTNDKFRRHPACGVVELNSQFEKLCLLIDAGYHGLENHFPAGTLDAILLTHFHMDHVQGLFTLRWGISNTIPVFSPDDPIGCDDLFKHPGILDFSYKTRPFESFKFKGIHITPVPLVHSKITMGYIIKRQGKRFAYLCDSGTLTAEVEQYLIDNPINVMILDCEEPPQENAPRNHNDLTQALAIFAKIKPKKLLLTHISHHLDVYFINNPNCLPAGVEVAYDNQTWEL